MNVQPENSPPKENQNPTLKARKKRVESMKSFRQAPAHKGGIPSKAKSVKFCAHNINTCPRKDKGGCGICKCVADICRHHDGPFEAQTSEQPLCKVVKRDGTKQKKLIIDLQKQFLSFMNEIPSSSTSDMPSCDWSLESVATKSIAGSVGSPGQNDQQQDALDMAGSVGGASVAPRRRSNSCGAVVSTVEPAKGPQPRDPLLGGLATLNLDDQAMCVDAPQIVPSFQHQNCCQAMDEEGMDMHFLQEEGPPEALPVVQRGRRAQESIARVHEWLRDANFNA